MAKNKHKHHQESEIVKDDVNTEATPENETEKKSDVTEEQAKDTTEAEHSEQKKPEVKQSKEEEYLLLAKKTQAEFENYKKRTIKAESEARLDGVIDAVKKFLPVIDSFMIAQKQETNQEYINTNSVIINQLNKALEDLGVKKIDALGKQFDYNYHNAIMVGNDPDIDDNQITEVFQDGYTLKDKVIRYSIVKINKK